MPIEIQALKNGPYQVSGDVNALQLKDANGTAYDLAGKSRVYLCRCGGSTTKPFCDGQHSKIGFQAAEAAVAGEDS